MIESNSCIIDVYNIYALMGHGQGVAIDDGAYNYYYVKYAQKKSILVVVILCCSVTATYTAKLQ